MTIERVNERGEWVGIISCTQDYDIGEDCPCRDGSTIFSPDEATSEKE